MSFPLVVTYRRSAPVFICIALIHAAAMISVWLAGGATDAVRLSFAIALLLSLAVSFDSWRATRGQLRLAADGSSDYRGAESEEFAPANLLWSAVWPHLAAAGFRLQGKRRSLGFVLITGTLPAEELRLFRVWLLNCRGKAD